MGTSLSKSTLLDSVRRPKHNIEHFQTFNEVQMHTLFSFLLFLHEITQKIRKLADMAMVITDKTPKLDANPIMGPEGHIQTVINHIRIVNACTYTQYMRMQYKYGSTHTYIQM